MVTAICRLGGGGTIPVVMGAVPEDEIGHKRAARAPEQQRVFTDALPLIKPLLAGIQVESQAIPLIQQVFERTLK